MRKTTLFALALTLAVVGQSAAQACIGMPTGMGEFAVYGSFETRPGLQSYGVGALGSLSPLFAGASYQIDDRGERFETGQTIGGLLGFELPVPTSSICLISEPSYSTFDILATSPVPAAAVRHIRVPILLAVGQRLDVGDSGIYVIPAARAGVTYGRNEVQAEGDDTAVSDNATDVLIAAGATVGRGVAFGRIGFAAVTGSGSRPELVLQVGLHLR